MAAVEPALAFALAEALAVVVAVETAVALAAETADLARAVIGTAGVDCFAPDRDRRDEGAVAALGDSLAGRNGLGDSFDVLECA
jgi:hypothetical protein